MSSLVTVAALLGAAVILVPLFKRAGLGTVLGYLAAGMLMGPAGADVVDDPEHLMQTAELGIVLLLFVIGLELQPSRLWALRDKVFGLGALQLLGVGSVIAAVCLAVGLSWKASLLIGWTLALSSTALVLPTLAERKELSTRHGREAFAILLFQDLSVIVLLALLPLLGVGAARAGVKPVTGLIVLAAVLVSGRRVLHWLFAYVARVGSREVFAAAALLSALGLAQLMQTAGLSLSLGAFIAGVLLSDSEFRHELEASIAPFQGLLLGLFFMTVGMSVDLRLLVHAPLAVFGMAASLLTLKAVVMYMLRRWLRGGEGAARPLALALAQGGEFAFVVFGLVEQGSLLPGAMADRLTLAVALSMAAAPLLFMLNDWFARYAKKPDARPYDPLPDDATPVVIAGFGRVGQMVGRMLLARGIPFTALDADADQVDTVRRFGSKVYFGDASHLDLLHAAHVDKAAVFVLAIDDVEASLKTAELVRRYFPHVKVVARARNRFHAYRLLDLGIGAPFRETLASSVEMGRSVLTGLGFDGHEIEHLLHRFLEHDRRLLLRQHAVYHDEGQLIQSSNEAREELASILEQDREAMTGKALNKA